MINLHVLFPTHTVRKLQDKISKNVYYYFRYFRGGEAKSEECKTGESREKMTVEAGISKEDRHSGAGTYKINRK